MMSGRLGMTTSSSKPSRSNAFGKISVADPVPAARPPLSQKRLAALDRDYYSRLLMVVGWYFEQRQQIQQGAQSMTWQIIVSGHNGGDEYGSDEYKNTEETLARLGEDFGTRLKTEGMGATTVRFAGNFVNRETSLLGSAHIPTPDPTP